MFDYLGPKIIEVFEVRCVLTNSIISQGIFNVLHFCTVSADGSNGDQFFTATFSAPPPGAANGTPDFQPFFAVS